MYIQIIENVRRVSNGNQRYKRNDYFWRNDFPGGSDSNASAYNVGDPSLIPGSGRSPGEGNGNRLQYSWLENPMDRRAWWATVNRDAKSQTRLSDFTFTTFGF